MVERSPEQVGLTVAEVPPGPVRYRLLSEHFQACADLPEREREEYLSGPSVTDLALREELRSLLQYHDHPQVPPPSTVRAVPGAPRRQQGLVPFLILGGSMILLVIVVRAWTLSQLEASARAEGMRQLQQILDHRVSSVRAFLERRKELTRSVLEDGALIPHVAALAEAARKPEALRSSPSYEAVSTLLSKAPGRLGECGFLLFDPAGVVLCSDSAAAVGRPLSPGNVAVARALAIGQWIVSRPVELGPETAGPVIFAGGPVRGDGGRILATGVFFFSPRSEFDGLLAAAGPVRLLISATPGRNDRETVLGTWTWLPEQDMGLGAEQEVDALLSSLQPLRSAFLFLMSVPAVLTGVLCFSTGALRLPRPRDGESIGFYVVERPIGQGGMGDVFLATHTVLRRPAALKILRDPRPNGTTVARFKREARMAGRLGHPNALQIFDYGETSDGRLYYAMEYVEGMNLAQLLTLEGPLPLARTLYLLRQISGAMEEAHALGMLHRDLKPSNIMVGRKGGLGDVVKILDFGIASSVSGGAEDITRSTNLVGTPAYMAPERIRRPHQLDFRSDVYSFGGVAFHLLTGRSLFEGPGPAELLYQVLTSKRPSPSTLRGDPLPEALEALILDCLAIEPELRPSSMSEISATLKTIETPEPWSQDEARAWWAENRENVARFTGASGPAA